MAGAREAAGCPTHYLVATSWSPLAHPIVAYSDVCCWVAVSEARRVLWSASMGVGAWELLRGRWQVCAALVRRFLFRSVIGKSMSVTDRRSLPIA